MSEEQFTMLMEIIDLKIEEAIARDKNCESLYQIQTSLSQEMQEYINVFIFGEHPTK